MVLLQFMLKRVTLFTKPGCHLCETVETNLLAVKSRVAFDLDVVNIMVDPVMAAQYGFDIPVVAVDGSIYSRHFLNEVAFEKHIKELNQDHAD